MTCKANGKISPSMMCCELGGIKNTLAQFQACGIEYLHIDVMDGVYVPNLALGTDYIRNLRELSPIPMDIHLMIVNPEAKLDWFDIREGDYVAVHYESTPHIHYAIMKLKQKGAKIMLALNPGTPICCLEELADDLNGVLVMTVNPGFAGQAMVEQTLAKITRVREWLDSHGHSDVEIEVDGNVSFQNARRMRGAGADIFVAGTSSIFTSELTLPDAIEKLRGAII